MVRIQLSLLLEYEKIYIHKVILRDKYYVLELFDKGRSPVVSLYLKLSQSYLNIVIGF